MATVFAVALALVQPADAIVGDPNTAKCYDSGDGLFYGSCGFLELPTSEWCEWLGEDYCFAERSDDCCEPHYLRIAALVAIEIVVILCLLISCCSCIGICPFYFSLCFAPYGIGILVPSEYLEEDKQYELYDDDEYYDDEDDDGLVEYDYDEDVDL